MSWPKRRKSGIPWLSLPIGGLLALVVLLEAPWDETLVPPANLEASVLDPRTDSGSDATATPQNGAPIAAPAAVPQHAGVLRRGETLGALLADLGLSGVEAHSVAVAAQRFIDPRQLRTGTAWSALETADGSLRRFDLRLDGRGEVQIERAGEAWNATFREFRRELRVRSVSGALEGALEGSVARSGADGMLAYAMAEVLQWDLDFGRDLQVGDRFRVLFEEVWLEGSYHGLGRILALSYGHQDGKSYEAYRFGGAEGGGYYDGEGRPLQKLFLRSPLPFSRVTSRFSHRRFHPILKAFRPHYGVDYGAPTGTAVRATASGTVTFAGWDGGGGRTVKVRHPNEYLTCYLHLAKFASGIRSGARVRQGDLVGYVGATGLATAPHLDYRVQHRGGWIDPMSLASVPAEPLTAIRLNEFRAVRQAMQASLETGRPFAPNPAVEGAPPERVAVASPSVRARK